MGDPCFLLISTRLLWFFMLWNKLHYSSMSSDSPKCSSETFKRHLQTPILASLHWLPVHFMVDFKILLLVYKCLNNLAPLYLSELLVQYNPSRGLRSGTQKLLSIPRYRLKHRGHCAFAISGPILWNSLHFHVRSVSDLSIFKSQL